jgi:hypothetical protein
VSVGRQLLPIAAGLVAVACTQERKPPEQFMLEVSGPPECLGELAGRMIDGGFGASETPIFQDRHGTIRFGPVAEPRLGAAIQTVKRTACASLAQVEKQ